MLSEQMSDLVVGGLQGIPRLGEFRELELMLEETNKRG